MFRSRERIQKWFYDIVEKFREKGALSPDKAMTPEELGLPPRFGEAMKRRLGRLGVFVEVNGKYYLSEERLKQIEEMRSVGGRAWNPRSRIMTLRLFQTVTVVLFVSLLLVNLYVQSWEIRLVSAVVLVVWLSIAILQIYFLFQARRRFSRRQSATSLQQGRIDEEHA